MFVFFSRFCLGQWVVNHIPNYTRFLFKLKSEVQSQNLRVGSRTRPALDGSIPQLKEYEPQRGPSGSAGRSVGLTQPWQAFHGIDVAVAGFPWD